VEASGSNLSSARHPLRRCHLPKLRVHVFFAFGRASLRQSKDALRCKSFGLIQVSLNRPQDLLSFSLFCSQRRADDKCLLMLGSSVSQSLGHVIKLSLEPLNF